MLCSSQRTDLTLFQPMFYWFRGEVTFLKQKFAEDFLISEQELLLPLL